MKVKKCLAVLITFALFCSLLLGSSVAGTTVTSLNLVDTDTDRDGPGWEWNVGTKTLTLDGLVLFDDEQAFGIYLPTGSTIILVEGSQNNITTEDGRGIYALGNLTIQGAGSLIIDASEYGITANGSIDIDGLTLLDVKARYDGIRNFISVPFGVTSVESSMVSESADLAISNCDTVTIDAGNNGLYASGNTMIHNVGTMSITARESGIFAFYAIDIDGLTLLDIGALADGLVTGFHSVSLQRVEVEPPPGYDSSQLTISNCDKVIIDADWNGIIVPGTVTIYNVDEMDIIGTWAGIKAYDDLQIKDVGQLDILTGGDGIDLYGDMYVENVDIMKIVAEDDGIYLQGDLLVDGVGDLHIIAGEHGINAATRGGYQTRDLDIIEESGGNITILKTDRVLIEAMPESFGYSALYSRYSVTFSDLDSFEISGYIFGIYATDISLSHMEYLAVEAIEVGLLAIEDQDRIIAVHLELAELNEIGSDPEGGTIQLSGIKSAEIIADHYGIVSFSEMIIENCSDLIVEATTGESFTEAGEFVPAQAAIIALGGPISIQNSSVYASGRYFGIMTGYVPVNNAEPAMNAVSPMDVEAILINPFAGGDITISRSFVIAQADAEIGYAGLFAGDNLEPEDPDKARIIIIDGSVIKPVEYWIVDVSIGETNSQSITALAIDLITDWIQAANYVEIYVDTYTVTYDANGGEGELVDPDSPYYVGSWVTVLDSPFSLEGYTFSSWNTAADGTGTTWQPGDTFEILDNVVLYAQYAEVIDETPGPDNGEEEEEREPIPPTGHNTASLWMGLLLMAAATTWLKKRLTA